MDANGRADHIEDALVLMNTGQWFTWTDSKNKVYANLKLAEKVGVKGEVVDNPVTSLPSESAVTTKLKEIQDAFDAKDYERKRREEYPKLRDQLDKIYHSGIDAWKVDIKAVKDKYPKP